MYIFLTSLSWIVSCFVFGLYFWFMWMLTVTAFPMFPVLFFLSCAPSSSIFMLMIFPFLLHWVLHIFHLLLYSYYNPLFCEFDVSELWSFVTWMRASLSFVLLVVYLIVNIWLFSLSPWQQLSSKCSSSDGKIWC